MKQAVKDRVVSINNPIKILYSDGQKILIRIFDEKPNQSHDSPEYFIQKDAPIAQAVLGHKVGDQVEYAVGVNKYKITILDC